MSSKIISKIIVVGSLLIGMTSIAAPLKEGDKFPDFQLVKLQEASKKGSKKVTASALKGKVVILDFWASWCEPCKIALPNYDQLYKKNKGKVMIVGINVDDESKSGQDFLKEHKVSFPILYDQGRKLIESISVSTMPTSFILDKDGKIVMIHKGFREGDEKEIAKKIAELTK
jgi:thiol-disulfide isomerase/thioredoxin